MANMLLLINYYDAIYTRLHNVSMGDIILETLVIML